MTQRTTKTVRLDATPSALVVEINRQEARLWSVRLILPTAEGYIVVFENCTDTR